MASNPKHDASGNDQEQKRVASHSEDAQKAFERVANAAERDMRESALQEFNLLIVIVVVVAIAVVVVQPGLLGFPEHEGSVDRDGSEEIFQMLSYNKMLILSCER